MQNNDCFIGEKILTQSLHPLNKPALCLETSQSLGSSRRRSSSACITPSDLRMPRCTSLSSLIKVTLSEKVPWYRTPANMDSLSNGRFSRNERSASRNSSQWSARLHARSLRYLTLQFSNHKYLRHLRSANSVSTEINACE